MIKHKLEFVDGFNKFCVLSEHRQHQSVVRLTLPPFSVGDVSLPHNYRHYQIIANPLEFALSTSTGQVILTRSKSAVPPDIFSGT